MLLLFLGTQTGAPPPPPPPPPPPAVREKGGAAGGAGFYRRRAEIVVAGKRFQIESEADAKRIIAKAVQKAKASAKKQARKAATIEAVPMPPVVTVDYGPQMSVLRNMAERANQQIAEYYAQAFARAIARAQEDEEEVAVLLLH